MQSTLNVHVQKLQTSHAAVQVCTVNIQSIR
ncbi:unnamed protein product [Callosobruchus maculatus]|uniref:Uncharacterized protein n=1 Tax=Callosobruchus maculatus TaxID=64391 RepID=A0A653C6L8_CALMS|nr:unnamed protein product [Callosobruchus maculatus]